MRHQRKLSIHCRVIAGVLSVLLQGVALAQTVDPGLQFRTDQERQQAEQQQLLNRPDVRLPTGPVASDERLLADEAPCFMIDRVVFEGDEPFRQDSLHWVNLGASLAGRDGDDPPDGHCLGAQSIGVLQKRAQNALVDAGYVTSRVVVGRQDISTGTLQLTVIPGRIGAVTLDDPDQRGHWWNALPSGPGDLLNLRDIEQGLENFKRLPTANADIQIAPAAPGASPGVSDLAISYHQNFPFRLTLTADNYGTKWTGRNEGSATLSWDNVIGQNDLFYVTFNHTLNFMNPDGRGTNGNTIYYAIPYGDWLLSADRYTYDYYQSVAGLNQNYVYSGTSAVNEVKLSRVMYRDAVNKYEAGIKGFSRRTNNFIDNTEVTVQNTAVGGWEGSLNGRRYFGESVIDGSAIWHQGTGAFGSQPAPGQALGDATSHMEILWLNASAQVPFKILDQGFSYNGIWRWQGAWTPLMPQDQFAIGGPYTVRGFDGNNQLVAGRGWLIRNDLNVRWLEWAAPYVGLDYGEVGGQGSQYLVGQKLAGAVIGLRGRLSNLQYDVFASQPVQKPMYFVTANYFCGFSLALIL